VITKRDLQEAIAECQGERNPTATTCIKLAAYFTIYDHLYPKIEEEVEQVPQSIIQSIDSESIPDYGDSDFYRTIRGRQPAEVWAVMNELMDTLQIINPKLYDGVMRQLL
jgi:hypothetical protein